MRSLASALGITAAVLSFAVDVVLAQFENVAIARSVDLGGSITGISIAYDVRATQDGAQEYVFALSREESSTLTFIEARTKEGKSLPLEGAYDIGLQASLFTTKLPKALKKDEASSLTLNVLQSHASKPHPPTAKQGDAQVLKYDSSMFVISPYPTVSQKTRVRSPTSNIHNYTIPSATPDAEPIPSLVSRTKDILTFGPFPSLPPTANWPWQSANQQLLSITYDFDSVVLTITSLQRAAEISHWGANLNIEDKIWLRNDGPTLKGQFSRLEHQQQVHFRRVPPQTLQSLLLHLPARVHSPYYYDLNGNVSTSVFRPSVGRNTKEFSLLELRPRYPVLGGWNYSFTVGWDAPLEDSVKYNAENGRYIAGVPFWTPLTGVAVDKAEVKVILPEGATDVQIHSPFRTRGVQTLMHKTYLDTTGRPAIVFTAGALTHEHDGIIYIEYSVPFSAHLKKPLAVAAAMLIVFTVSLFARRVNVKISQ